MIFIKAYLLIIFIKLWTMHKKKNKRNQVNLKHFMFVGIYWLRLCILIKKKNFLFTSHSKLIINRYKKNSSSTNTIKALITIL